MKVSTVVSSKYTGVTVTVTVSRLGVLLLGSIAYDLQIRPALHGRIYLPRSRYISFGYASSSSTQSPSGLIRHTQGDVSCESFVRTSEKQDTDYSRPLMLTDKETKDLSREIYYGENTFTLSNDPRNYMKYEKFLRTPHPAHRPWVRKLELFIHDRHDRSHQFSCAKSEADPMHDLAWPIQLKPSFLLYNLFEPRDEVLREKKNRGYRCEEHGQGDLQWTCGRTKYSAEWQNQLDDVRELKIVMIGTPCFTCENSMLPGGQTPEQVVNRLSSQIRISMGTRKLKLVMEEGDGWHYNKYCKVLCTGILQSLVKGLVEIRTAKD